MASVIELYKYLDKSIPSSLSCDWDNDGLMCCPDPDREVKKVLFTLDITEKAASYAIENGYDLIISHHPLIFRPISNVAFDKSVSRTVMMRVKAGISAFSFHTRLDSLNGGVNDALAERLEIVDPEELDESGAGRIGYLSDSMTAAEFANFVKKGRFERSILTAPSHKTDTPEQKPPRSRCAGSVFQALPSARLPPRHSRPPWGKIPPHCRS